MVGCMDGWISEWVTAWMDRWTDELMDYLLRRDRLYILNIPLQKTVILYTMENMQRQLPPQYQDWRVRAPSKSRLLTKN